MAVRSRPRQRVMVAGPATPIPDKLYFRIGEAAYLVGVEPHVLRYWEREVAAVRPSKSASNQRRYRRKDVELFREIRRLLHDERYTLAGARRRLAVDGRRAEEPSEEAISEHDESARVEADVATELQLPLALPAAKRVVEEGRLGRLRDGLRDLIRLAGEEPPL